MAIIGNINGIPLFSTRQEALSWASSNNLTGYHTHTYKNQIGYMGGATHGQATNNAPVVRVTPTPSTQTSTPSTNSGSGGY